jgi:phage tail sheath protein FI
MPFYVQDKDGFDIWGARTVRSDKRTRAEQAFYQALRVPLGCRIVR